MTVIWECRFEITDHSNAGLPVVAALVEDALSALPYPVAVQGLICVETDDADVEFRPDFE